MDIETFQVIISVFGLFGIGGIIGAYIQHLFDRQKQIGLEIRKIKEERYRSTLVHMRLVLNPEKFDQFTFEKNKSHSTTKEHEMEMVIEYYYNSLLYATDEVLIRLKDFIRDSNEDTFAETAIAMRNDLWGIKRQYQTKEFSLK
ncbi:hypothetical protein [Methanoregula sp.]|uniref:hypothetical protein n=1 Tax=Methanoregula sp. TaxID=2052170 RepID=UPI003C71EC91